MPRFLSRAVLLGTVLLLGACSDAVTPTGKDVRSGARADIIGPDRTLVQNTLNALYPVGAGITTAANAQLSNIFRSLDGNHVKAAQQQAAAFCTFTQKQFAAGRLASTATSAKVADFCDQLYLSTGLAPGGIDVSGEDALAQYVPACTGVSAVLNTGLAGVKWDARRDPNDASSTCTFNVPVTLIITPIDYHAYSAGSGPIAYTGGNQWPFFYEITVVPYTIPNNPVTVNVCTINDGSAYSPPEAVHSSLRLAHNVPAEGGGVTAEVLPTAPLFINCLPPGTAQADFMSDARNRGVMFASRSALRRAGSALLDLASPRPLYAAHVGVGGLAGSFSPFGAVEAPQLSTDYTIKAIDPGSFTAVVYTSSIAYSAGATQLYIRPVLTSTPAFTGTCGSWSSSSPSVATVNPTTGVLTPVIGPNGTTRVLGSTTISAICGSNLIQGPFTIYDPAIPPPIL